VYMNVVDGLFVAMSLSIYVGLKVDTDWQRGVSFEFSRDVAILYCGCVWLLWRRW
jgi:hypothetical protein